MPANS
jgi:integrase